MPVVHRTHVRISRIAAPLAGGIGDHHFGLGANVRVAFAQRDGIAITLRHLAPIKSRNPRRLRQHRLGLNKHIIEAEVALLVFPDGIEEVSYSYFRDMSA